jgi:hypothetical protein
MEKLVAHRKQEKAKLVGVEGTAGEATALDPPYVIVSMEALVQGFFDGIDRALADPAEDSARTELALRRFQKMFHTYPASSLVGS